MARRLKASTLAILILTGVALGVLGYWFGNALNAGSAVAQSPGPGAIFDPPLPVADFTLTDQRGQPFTFSSTRGKVVVLAFLFTHCPDVCPFSAIKMRQALDQLGDNGRNVELVVVSTDPERDTIPVIADYSRQLGLYDRWHMVTGPLADMQKLYKDLKITVIKAAAEDEPAVKNAQDLGLSLPQKDQADSPLFGLSDNQVLEGSKVAKAFSGGYQVAHSTPFWVVDPQGRVRVSLDVSASPSQLAEAIKSYLKG